MSASSGAGGPGGGGAGGTPPANPGSNGTVNTGGGGGGGRHPGGLPLGSGGTGGSGVVIVKEKAQSYFAASGVWSLSDAYNYKKQNQWG
jgi:hypothetical protein